jgi:hypothetical protein
MKQQLNFKARHTLKDTIVFSPAQICKFTNLKEKDQYNKESER